MFYETLCVFCLLLKVECNVNTSRPITSSTSGLVNVDNTNTKSLISVSSIPLFNGGTSLPFVQSTMAQLSGTPTNTMKSQSVATTSQSSNGAQKTQSFLDGSHSITATMPYGTPHSPQSPSSTQFSSATSPFVKQMTTSSIPQEMSSTSSHVSLHLTPSDAMGKQTTIQPKNTSSSTPSKKTVVKISSTATSSQPKDTTVLPSPSPSPTSQMMNFNTTLMYTNFSSYQTSSFTKEISTSQSKSSPFNIRSTTVVTMTAEAPSMRTNSSSASTITETMSTTVKSTTSILFSAASLETSSSSSSNQTFMTSKVSITKHLPNSKSPKATKNTSSSSSVFSSSPTKMVSSTSSHEPTQTPTKMPTKEVQKKKKDNETALIVGLTVGLSVTVLILALVVICLRKRRSSYQYNVFYDEQNIVMNPFDKPR